MKKSKLLLTTSALLTLLFLTAALSPFAASEQSIGFVTGVLPPPPPGSTSNYNQAAEPQVASDGFGNFYITSENGLGSGTDAWKSTNGGTSYFSLPQPNAVSSASVSQTTGLAPGGGDVAIAIASKLNGQFSNSQYNIYVASLTLGSVTVSASQDGGFTWQSNVLSANVPADDREWIAAYGSTTYYLSYHNIATGFQIIINEGSLVNGIPTTVQTYQAINPAQQNIYLGTIADNEIGNLVVDQNTGIVYQIFVGCPPGTTQVVTCSSFSTVYVAVGLPVGLTVAGEPILNFTDYVIYQSQNSSSSFNNNFPVIALDKAGNVYASWSDGQNVYLSYSRDFGKAWSTPVKVNSGNAVTAIYPWLAAGNAGQVDVVYYGTPAPSNFQTCSNGTPGQYDCQNEPWYVFFAQNLHVFSQPTSWTQVQVTGVVHYGGVCQGGVTCSSVGNDNRDLYDDFGIAVSPITGLASIAYSDDQYSDIYGTSDSGLCSASQSNSASCDHTDFATQISGTGVLQKHPGFEINKKTLDQESGEAEFDLALTNNANTSIQSISVTLNGIPLNLAWNASFPVGPGNTISATYLLLSLSPLQLTLGSVYQIQVTAYFSDGSNVTDTENIIYSGI
ncbi:MAG: hypothetical protein QXV32_06850 [Conexivisphaerales archaeon]